MRFSLRRVVQWGFIIALLQMAVYYFTVKRPRRLETRLAPHKFLESIVRDEGTCSFKTCPQIKEGMINVHLVPHSHIDVGWLKTVDQYYTGEAVPNGAIAGCVRCILNTTITELLKDSSRRFIFIEMKYLSRFWHEVDELKRENIRQLIRERRLEIVNGGWVMSDAAVTSYNDIIDQHTLGFDFISNTFGPCGHSRTAWHVDQFGHSREHASLFAQMGYDSLFIGRIDFQDLIERKENKNLEFLWNTSPRNLKERSTLFVQTTFDGYYAPPEYVFDDGDITMLADPPALERSAHTLVRLLQERAKSFKTNQLLVPMGSDFGYKDASRWYTKMDALIQKVNAMKDGFNGMRLNLMYSTPSCYTYYVNKGRQVFDVKTNDFHPYGVSPGVYWTGYFTTRGGLKMHIRRAGQILQTCKQLSIFSSLSDSFNKINELRDALSVMQHHDAITGTQTLRVLLDYNRMLSESEDQCLAVISEAYQKLWNREAGIEEANSVLTAKFCPDLNISSCPVSENSDQFVATLYNSLSWPVDVPVRLPVKLNQVTITDWSGDQVQGQLVPVPEGVKKIPERSSMTENELVFMAHLLPMSVASFKIKSEKGKPEPPAVMESSTSDIVIENQHLSLTFSATTGKLVSMYNKNSQVKEDVAQEFAYYVGQQGGPRPSGAYVFVPVGETPNIVASGKIEIKVIKGKVVQEVHQKFCDWAFQTVRLYDGAKYAEFQWTVGPLEDDKGREVISKFTTSLKSNETFYTDSNGREIMQRIRETPGVAKSKVKDFASGNYYPVTNRIFIQDEEKQVQLSVIPDRSQGGSSLASGALELMVHRKLLFDDGLGVSEPLNDVGVDRRGIIFTGKHYVCLDTIANSVLLTKHLALQTQFAPVVMFTPLNNSQFDSAFKQHNFLYGALPDNVQILTLDRIPESGVDQYLLRLEHVFEEDEHQVLSKPAELSLQSLFEPFEIISAEETTLGGNFRPHEITRLEWATVEGRTQANIESPDYNAAMEQPFKIKLHPMEIRTFRVQLARVL